MIVCEEKDDSSWTLQCTEWCALGGLWNSGTIISGPPGLARRGTKRTWRVALNFSQRKNPVLFNPCLLVTRARALNFFGQELCLARPSPFLALPPRRSCLLGLVDIKAGGRKWEESSYQSRVREWKREGEKSEEKERRAGRKLELENSSLPVFVCSLSRTFCCLAALSVRSKILARSSKRNASDV